MNGYNFTDRVRHVLQLARMEAGGLHHDYVGTEHILLGFLAKGDGVGVTALESLQIDLAQVRETVLYLCKPGKSTTQMPELPYTSRAKKTLELAMMEARDLRHSYVGTEHLLLGLIREEKGIAAQVLCKVAGMNAEDLRTEIHHLLNENEAVPGATRSAPARTARPPRSMPPRVPTEVASAPLAFTPPPTVAKLPLVVAVIALVVALIALAVALRTLAQ